MSDRQSWQSGERRTENEEEGEAVCSPLFFFFFSRCPSFIVGVSVDLQLDWWMHSDSLSLLFFIRTYICKQKKDP